MRAHTPADATGGDVTRALTGRAAAGPLSRVELFPLALRPEGDELIAGRLDGGDFVALPQVGAQALELLGRGLSVAETEQRLAHDGAPEVDVAAFVETLRELGFVRALDGVPEPVAPVRAPNLPWLRRRHVAWLFHPLTLGAATALVLAAAAAVARRPALWPSYEDFLWAPWPGVVVLVNTLVVTAGVAIHELFHLFAARSLDVPARIGVSTRLATLVVQTDVTGLWALPPRRRQRVYLAGIGIDLVLVAGLFLMLSEWPLAPAWDKLARWAILARLLAVAFQAHVYMRTDLYFVFTTALACRNLYGDSLAFLRHLPRTLLRRLRGAPPTEDPLAALPRRERAQVRLYSVVVLVGSLVALAAFALYGVPVLVLVFVQGATRLVGGVRAGLALQAFDAALALVVEGFYQGVFVYALWKNHGARLRRPRPTRA